MSLGLRTSFLSCALVITLWPALAAAQTVTGTLKGAVIDTTGAPVPPGVAITVRGNVDTGSVREYCHQRARLLQRRAFLPIGRYKVSASLAGFGPVVRDARSRCRLNDTRVVDFKLDPPRSRRPSRSAAAPPINLTNAEIKGR